MTSHTPSVDPKDAEIARLQRELAERTGPKADMAEFGKVLATEIAKALKAPAVGEFEPVKPVKAAPLAEEYKGKKTYRLNAPHYRKGERFEVGETITVTDEKPSRTWELIDEDDKPRKPKAAVPPASKRPSDEGV